MKEPDTLPSGSVKLSDEKANYSPIAKGCNTQPFPALSFRLTCTPPGQYRRQGKRN